MPGKRVVKRPLKFIEGLEEADIHVGQRDAPYVTVKFYDRNEASFSAALVDNEILCPETNQPLSFCELTVGQPVLALWKNTHYDASVIDLFKGPQPETNKSHEGDIRDNKQQGPKKIIHSETEAETKSGKTLGVETPQTCQKKLKKATKKVKSNSSEAETSASQDTAGKDQSKISRKEKTKGDLVKKTVKDKSNIETDSPKATARKRKQELLAEAKQKKEAQTAAAQAVAADLFNNSLSCNNSQHDSDNVSQTENLVNTACKSFASTSSENESVSNSMPTVPPTDISNPSACTSNACQSEIDNVSQTQPLLNTPYKSLPSTSSENESLYNSMSTVQPIDNSSRFESVYPNTPLHNGNSQLWTHPGYSTQAFPRFPTSPFPAYTSPFQHHSYPYQGMSQPYSYTFPQNNFMNSIPVMPNLECSPVSTSSSYQPVKEVSSTQLISDSINMLNSEDSCMEVLDNAEPCMNIDDVDPTQDDNCMILDKDDDICSSDSSSLPPPTTKACNNSPRSDCAECIRKDLVIADLKEQLKRQNRLNESNGNSQISPSSREKKYKPQTRPEISFSDYIPVSSVEEIPNGYQVMAPGAPIAVRSLWLHDILSSIGKSQERRRKRADRKKKVISEDQSVETVKRLIDSFFDPWELNKAGGSKCFADHPVYVSLKLYATHLLKMSEPKFKRAWNTKMVASRQTMKRLGLKATDDDENKENRDL